MIKKTTYITKAVLSFSVSPPSRTPQLSMIAVEKNVKIGDLVVSFLGSVRARTKQLKRLVVICGVSPMLLDCPPPGKGLAC